MKDQFYIIAREPGAEHPAIPTWANHHENPASLETPQSSAVKRVEVEGVPGAFQLLNVLTKGECDELRQITESLGYIADAAVSLPRSVRHNDSVTWVVDDETETRIWSRCEEYIHHGQDWFLGKKPCGLNQRFRFYRYQPGDYFKAHTDGSWPGSKVIDGQLEHNAFADRWSQLTILLFLTDDYQGGGTCFYPMGLHGVENSEREAECVTVRTPQGGALCFPHGNHPLHCLHSSEPIIAGEKYIIRSDVLFEI